MHMLRMAAVMLLGSLTAFGPGKSTNPAPERGKAAAGGSSTFSIAGPTQITSAGSYGYEACTQFYGFDVVLEFWLNGQSVDRFTIDSPAAACQTHTVNVTTTTPDFTIYAVVKVEGFNQGTTNTLSVHNAIPTPLTASIVGQGCAYPPFGNTWTAFPQGGTGGYTYHWSGVLSGTGSSISSQPSSSGYLFLEVNDSNSGYASAQIYIDTTDPGC